MRPKDLRTKIFLDSGDQEETKKTLNILGFLDGQTTNPTLVAKNPEIAEKIKKGDKFSKEEIYTSYKKIVQDIAKLIPQGSVSTEVYADFTTTSKQMIEEARELNSWIPNAHIKLPIVKSGLMAANSLVKENIRVNMTLCFTQEQGRAVLLATRGAKRGDVFISPFVGRLDDIGVDGISLISNILKEYKESGEDHVEVLGASVRNLKHFMALLSLKCDIITAPFSVLKEWAEGGYTVPAQPYNSNGSLKELPFNGDLSSINDWEKVNIENELTTKGIERFCLDWKALTA